MRRAVTLLISISTSLIAFPVGAQSGSHGQSAQAADAAEAKRADIVKLMAAMDAGKVGVQAMQQAAEAQKKVNPGIPAEFWDAFLKEMTADKLVEVSIPVYERNLTQGEVSAMLAFFGTPEGKSVMQKLPKIMAECGEAGQKLGQEIGAKVAQRLQAEGKLGK